MKLLSSLDEILLLVILSLGRNAYGVTIRQKLSKVTGKEWSIGSIYDPLYRLEEKEFVRSEVTEPTTERGGRSKRLFFVTEEGETALAEHKKLRSELSAETDDLAFDA